MEKDTQREKCRHQATPGCPGGVGPRRRARLRGRATDRLKAAPSLGHFSCRCVCTHAVMAWSPLLPFLPVLLLLLLLQVPTAAHASPLGTLPEGEVPCKVGTATAVGGWAWTCAQAGLAAPFLSPDVAGAAWGLEGTRPVNAEKPPYLIPGSVAKLSESFRFPTSG